MKFDPSATPECDVIQPAHTRLADWIDLADRQERKARITEEKLRIALEGLKFMSSIERAPIIIQFEAASLLAKIERVEI